MHFPLECGVVLWVGHPCQSAETPVSRVWGGCVFCIYVRLYSCCIGSSPLPLVWVCVCSWLLQLYVSVSMVTASLRKCICICSCCSCLSPLGMGTRQGSRIRGGVFHIRALVFMLHTHACVHFAVRIRGSSTFMN